MEEREEEGRAHHEGLGSIPGVGEGPVQTECVEWCPICRTMDVLRASTTPEVREQWQGIQREALLTLRALIDHYAQRLSDHGRGTESAGEGPRRSTPVEEIPPVE